MQYAKIPYLFIGSIFMGIGIACVVLSNFGGDPMTLTLMGLAKQLSISFGQANVLVAFVFVSVVVFIDRSQLHIGTIINPIVIMVSSDIVLSMPLETSSVAIRMFYLLFGFLILSFGIAMYASRDYGKGAYDALAFGISKRFNVKFVFVRLTSDFLLIVLGVFLGVNLTFAPFLAMLLLGSLVQQFLKLQIFQMPELDNEKGTTSAQ